MAVFSSTTLNYARLTFLTFVSYLLLTDPKSVLEYNGTMLLGTAMNLPILVVNDNSPIYGSIAFLIIFAVLNDLLPLLDGNTAYFELVVPVRLLAYFMVLFYCYLGSYVFISNSLVFVMCFTEICFGILIFTSMKEEKEIKNKEFNEKQEELKQKFERGELDAETTEIIDKEREEKEFKKIMEEFER